MAVKANNNSILPCDIKSAQEVYFFSFTCDLNNFHTTN